MIAGYARLNQTMSLKDVALRICPVLATAFTQVMIETRHVQGKISHPQFLTQDAALHLTAVPEIHSLWLNQGAQRFEVNLMTDGNISMAWPVPDETEDTSIAARHLAMSEVLCALVTQCEAAYAFTSLYAADLSDIHEALWEQLQHRPLHEVIRQAPDYFWMFVCPAPADLAIAGFQSRQKQGCQLLINPQKPTFWPG